MRAGCWFPIIAIVGLIALAGGAEGHGGGKGSYQRYLQAKQSNPEPPQHTSTVAVEPIEAKDVTPPCGEGGNQNDSDLCQQWRMAEAADQMVQVTRLHVWLTFASLLGLAGTIWYARRSAVHTLDIGHAQVRAYIVIKPLEYNSKTKLTRVSIKNTGQSPAQNVRHLMATSFLPWPVTEEPGDLVVPIAGQANPTTMIGYGLDSTTDAPWEDRTGVGDAKDICVYGIVNYDDVFGRSYKHRFCARWTVTIHSDVSGYREEHKFELANFHNDEKVASDDSQASRSI